MANVYQTPTSFTATDSAKPSSNVVSGSLLYCADSNTLYVGSSTSAWQAPISSGSLASGQIAATHISSGTIIGQSGIITTANATNITHGLSLGSGVIQSGMLGLAVITNTNLSSGAVQSGSIGSYAINSINLNSGTISAAGGSQGAFGYFSGMATPTNTLVTTITSQNGIVDIVYSMSNTLGAQVRFRLSGIDMFGNISNIVEHDVTASGVQYSHLLGDSWIAPFTLPAKSMNFSVSTVSSSGAAQIYWSAVYN